MYVRIIFLMINYTMIHFNQAKLHNAFSGL